MFVRTVVVLLVCFALATFAQDVNAVPKRKSVREFGTATEKLSRQNPNAVPSDSGIKALLARPPRMSRPRESEKDGSNEGSKDESPKDEPAQPKDGPALPPRGPKPPPRGAKPPPLAGGDRPEGVPPPRGPKPPPGERPEGPGAKKAGGRAGDGSSSLFSGREATEEGGPGRHGGGHRRGGDGRKGLRGGREGREGRRPRGDRHSVEDHHEEPQQAQQQQQQEAEDNHEDEIVVEVRMKKIPQGDSEDHDHDGPGLDALKEGMLGKRGAGRGGRGGGERGGKHRERGGAGGRGGGGRRERGGKRGGEHSDD